MYTEDDSDAIDRRVVVKREHYEAGLEILKTKALGNAAFDAAEQRRDECKAGGDSAGVAFWGKVYDFLMDKAAATGDAEIVILEAGEEWDGENERVIRKGSKP